MTSGDCYSHGFNLDPQPTLWRAGTPDPVILYGSSISTFPTAPSSTVALFPSRFPGICRRVVRFTCIADLCHRYRDSM
jgi:hypothetical protein